MLVDSHCHVHFHAYEENRADVIQRSLAKGIHLLTVGTQKETSKQAIEVAEKYDGVWAAVGLFPPHLVASDFEDTDELATGSNLAEVFDMNVYRVLASHPKCVAIGECGLDYHRLPEQVDRSTLIKLQKQTVRAHFDLADELGLPVIIHCRDAYADQLEIVREYIEQGKLKQRGVVHCFGGTLEDAQAFVELGFKIGITGIVTFPPRKSDVLFDGYTLIQHIARTLPLSSLLVETDAPYLTPVPHRGERNEPAFVEFVARKIAELKGISFEEVAEATSQNIQSIFHIPK